MINAPALKKTLTIITVGILLLLVGSTYWVFIGAKTGSQMCKSHDWPIQSKRISDEKHFPFLMFGRPISNWKERRDYAEYRAAIARFPDVTSCLLDSERQEKVPNLALFDWNKIRGNEEAEVCMFRVFSSIGSVEGATRWLDGQGFTIGNTDEIPVSIMERRGEESPGVQIDASWSIKECGERFRYRGIIPNILSSTLLHAHALSVGVQFGADGELDMTSVVRLQK